jgi:plasmid stabilization system protein ParE
MARFRLARPAQIDLADILATSAERWGTNGRQKYAAVLADAMRQVAAEPDGPLTRKRPDLRSGIRSFHALVHEVFCGLCVFCGCGLPESRSERSFLQFRNPSYLPYD